MDPVSRYPLEEYKVICEMMRGYALLRFYQMALLLGTCGGLLTVVSSETVRRQAALFFMLKLGGLVMSVVFTIMDYRASAYWHGLRLRANELALELGFLPLRVRSPWNPLTTTGASLVLHLFFVGVFLLGLLHPVAS